MRVAARSAPRHGGYHSGMDSSLQHVLVAVCGLAAAAWLLVVAATAGWGMRVRGGEDAGAVVDYARRMAQLSVRVALPAALVLAVAGSWYVLGRDLGIAEHWWIGTALGAWIVAFFGSTLLRGAQLGHAVKLSGTQGVDDEDVQWRIRQVDLTARGELLLLAVAVVVVLVRP